MIEFVAWQMELSVRDDEWNIRQLLRENASEDELKTFIRNVAWAKSAGHGMDRSDFVRPEKTMSTIGG